MFDEDFLRATGSGVLNTPLSFALLPLLGVSRADVFAFLFGVSFSLSRLRFKIGLGTSSGRSRFIG